MTSVWDYPDFDSHEGLHLFTDPASGLKAVIAVHSTTLGPAASSTSGSNISATATRPR